MDMAEEPILIIMRLAGHIQSRSVAGSFREFYTLQKERAKAISFLRADMPITLNLRRDAAAAVVRAFVDYETWHTTMLAASLHTAERRVFIDQVSARGVRSVFADIDDRIKTATARIRDAEEGLADFQQPDVQLLSKGSPASATLPLAEPASPVALPSASADTYALSTLVIQPSSEPLGKKLKTDAQKGAAVSSATLSPGASAGLWPRGVYNGWGDHAVRWGVWLSPYGLVYGNKLRQNTSATPVNFKKGCCIAAAGPCESAVANSRWCVDVESCAKRGIVAHEFASSLVVPGSVSPSDMKLVQLTKAQLADRPNWRCIVQPREQLQAMGEAKIEAPNPPWRVTFGPQRDSAYPKNKSFERQPGDASSSCAESSGPTAVGAGGEAAAVIPVSAGDGPFLSLPPPRTANHLGLQLGSLPLY